MPKRDFSLAASIATLRKTMREIDKWIDTFVLQNDIVAVNALIEGGVSVDGDKDSSFSSPLHIAVANAHLEMAAFLIEKGACLECSTREWSDEFHKHYQEFALHTAARQSADKYPREGKKHIPLAHLLINKGANVSVEDELHQTPLHLAVRSLSVVEHLIQAGAPVDAKDSMDRTPLHRAASIASDTVVAFFIAKGADVNAKDSTGMTPLHYAADIKQRDEYDSAPLVPLGARRHRKACEILIESGADLHARNRNAWTPLHIVAASDDPSVELFNFLLAKGALGEMKDRHGRTAFDLAIDNRSIDRIDLHKWLVRASGVTRTRARERANEMA